MTKYHGVSVTCGCGVVFETSQFRIDAGRGRYCSRDCRAKYSNRGRKHTKKHEFQAPVSSWFQKGQEPWNAGTKGVCQPNITSFQKGVRVSPMTEFTSGRTSGSSNVKWKGDAVGYFGLHSWVARTLGRASKCSQCAADRHVHWANKSHHYNRDVGDWIALCAKCHGKYDSGTSRGAIARKYGVSA